MDKDELKKEFDKLEKDRQKLEEKLNKLEEEKKELEYLNGTKRLHGRKLNKKISKKREEISNDFSSYDSYRKGYKDAIYEESNHKRVTKKVEQNKNLAPLIIVVVIISFISGLLGTLLVIYLNGGVNTSTINTKSVTITETNSIADAVEKVYDAVVVVEGYTDGTLYSTGTGFVYKQENNKSYIMTNNHVIEGSETIKVLFNNGKEVETKVVGSDTYSDIAVLSIDETKDISVASLGSTEVSKVGDAVFTVGSPEGSDYAGTVTKGVLSAKDRFVAVSLSSSTTSDYYMTVLQTDAAINPGNSGGPICNTNGEVIGITNMKLVDDSVEGMGFAIPIEEAVEVAEVLETEGKISRPYIGISMLDISESYYLWQAGIMIPSNVTEGVAVYSVEDNSPASKASLQKGDIIISVENQKVSSLADFRYELYKHSPGETIEIKYNRNGKEQTTKVTLGTNEK